LHGDKLAEATRKRAKNFCQAAKRFSCRNVGAHAFSFAKNPGWCSGKADGKVNSLL
jgi:hypothetical protein